MEKTLSIVKLSREFIGARRTRKQVAPRGLSHVTPVKFIQRIVHIESQCGANAAKSRRVTCAEVQDVIAWYGNLIVRTKGLAAGMLPGGI
jgi:hypothetical protein